MSEARRDIELEDAAHKALVEDHGQNPNRRYVGYFYSQSIKKLLDYANKPENIQELHGRRRVQENSRQPFEGRELDEYATATYTENLEIEIGYDRANHADFRWEPLREWLEHNREVWDIPLNRAVVRIEDDGLLEEKWVEFIENATGQLIEDGSLPTGWIESPFYAVFEASYPGSRQVRDSIETFHEDYYFLPPSQNDGEHDGLGWQTRSMDLVAVWSHRAFVDVPNIVATRKAPDGRKQELTPRKLEDYLINFYDTDKPRIGAVNSRDFITTWKQACFDRAVDQKQFEWTEEQGWKQTNGE